MKPIIGRIATFYDWEHQIQVAPDVWDVDPDHVCRVAEAANTFLEEKQVQVMPPVSYEVKLIEQREQGRRRIYLHTLAVVYIPQEVIRDGERETQGTSQEEETKASRLAEIANGQEIRLNDIGEVGRLLNQVGIDPNEFAAAAGGNLPISSRPSPGRGVPPGLPLPGPVQIGRAPPAAGGG